MTICVTLPVITVVGARLPKTVRAAAFVMDLPLLGGAERLAKAGVEVHTLMVF